jgi:hypothetical protein
MQYRLTLVKHRRVPNSVALATILIVGAGLASCDGSQVPPPAPPKPTPNVSDYVTGEAAAALNVKGETSVMGRRGLASSSIDC